MSISPFTARPGSPENERRRARLVVLLATLGIVASLLAYGVSPTVRHAVGHAAHSVKGAVGHVLDHDRSESAKQAAAAKAAAAKAAAAKAAAARRAAAARAAAARRAGAAKRAAAKRAAARAAAATG